jgi:hypothetical protein
MRLKFTVILTFLNLFTLCVQFASAADPAATENRMRDALRNTMLQLRSCETERATLQAAKAEADGVNKGLTEKVDALTAKSAKAEKELAGQAAALASFKEANAKWQAAYQQATDLANKKEAERARLADQNILLQRQVEDQQRRNAELFKLGNEILTRYEHFGLGDALAAKEPFVGITRVKLENLVQDYRDKLADQRIKP